MSHKNNQIFGAQSLPPGKSLADTPIRSDEKHQIGWHYHEKGKLNHQNAWLFDRPARTASNNSSMTFETTALAIDGAQRGTYYGSVKWGWKRGSDGVLKTIDFELVSPGTPSENFLVPATAWNAATARGTLVARNNPTQVFQINKEQTGFIPAFTIAGGTRVTSPTTRNSIGSG